MHQRGTRPIYFDKRPGMRLLEKLTNTPRSVVPVYPSLFLFFKNKYVKFMKVLDYLLILSVEL